MRRKSSGRPAALIQAYDLPTTACGGGLMEHVRLGKTGLKVSRICLGCMSYGVPDRGPHPWTLDEEKSRPFIRRSLEAGINFFDTANVYSDGTSEEIVGRALRDFARRDEVVLATKVHGRMRPDVNGRGLSRKAILAEIDNSLRRLGTDLRGSLPDPSLGRRDADRGNARSAERCRQGGQGAVYRRVDHVCLAVLQGPLPGRAERLDAVRVDAEPLQSALPRRRAGDDARCVSTRVLA